MLSHDSDYVFDCFAVSNSVFFLLVIRGVPSLIFAQTPVLAPLNSRPVHTCPGLPTDFQWYIGNPKMLCFGISVCQVSHSALSVMSYCSSHPTVPWDGIDGLGSYQSVPLSTLCPYCPSHPTVQWEGMDGLGSYQSVPLSTLCPYCPSHPTVPWDRMDRL